MGFRQVASNDLIDLTQCPVLMPELEALLQPLHRCLSTLFAVKRLGHVEPVLADNGPLMMLRHLDALAPEDRAKLERFSHCSIWTMGAPLAGAGCRTVFLPCVWFTTSPQDFIQVNDNVNQQMVAKAIE